MPRPSFLPSPFWSLFLLIALVCLMLPPSASSTSLSHQLTEEIRSVLVQQDPPRIVLGRPITLDREILPQFYRQREYRPAWVGDLGLSIAAHELLDTLRGAAQEGLCPEDYRLGYLEPLAGLEADYRSYGILFDPTYMARLDLLLTDVALRYASDLMDGRVDPASVNEGWRTRSRRTDLGRLLRSAVAAGGQVSEALAALAPAHRGYRQLREALAEYRQISAMGGWPSIPAGSVLRSGGSDTRLPLLRERLLLSGDLMESDESAGELFDAATEAALVRFQTRHGLDPDGVLGAMTLAALNVSVEERIRQIEINMERWRWVQENLGSRYLQVNIADFSLQVMEQGRTVMSMPVVVGTAYRKTPLFSARMTYLEFAPFWTVPSTILREDKLPLIKRNPGWLSRHHYEIIHRTPGKNIAVDPSGIDWEEVDAKTFPGSLRQKPGPWNPLGQIKFMFPNRFAVYLHDTPDRQLFARDVRSFSSGCIRIERPLDLAQYLLEGVSGWDCDLILDAMKSKVPLEVGLPASLPVHILYWTAWVDEGGLLQFRKDFYLRDLDLDLALLEETGGRSDSEEGKLLTAGP